MYVVSTCPVVCVWMSVLFVCSTGIYLSCNVVCVRMCVGCVWMCVDVCMYSSINLSCSVCMDVCIVCACSIYLSCSVYMDVCSVCVLCM